MRQGAERDASGEVKEMSYMQERKVFGNTHILQHTLNIFVLDPSSRALCDFPPTRTLHRHNSPFSAVSWLDENSSLSDSSRHKKCANRFFAPSVKCTVSSPMTYAYTIFLTSGGSLLKNKL
ncbi:unnamed protein product [Periconia digitata]|uniref:Uncharacterized protein n=1 Tax=Periconia digitata TaxID=1303443 RepID=A0A9W4XTM9_9PLEO|nr:unnamed protein product [Periconia digitata]